LREYQEDDAVNDGHDKKTNKQKKKSRVKTIVIAATIRAAFYQWAVVAAGSIVPSTTESGTASDFILIPASVTKPIIIVQTETPESEWDEDGEDTDTETESGAETETETETDSRCSNKEKKKRTEGNENVRSIKN
jgi:hypothetical protein